MKQSVTFGNSYWSINQSEMKKRKIGVGESSDSIEADSVYYTLWIAIHYKLEYVCE